MFTRASDVFRSAHLVLKHSSHLDREKAPESRPRRPLRGAVKGAKQPD
jgi:hypothetical protein